MIEREVYTHFCLRELLVKVGFPEIRRGRPSATKNRGFVKETQLRVSALRVAHQFRRIINVI